jgi:hypothetical protein
MDRLYKDVRYFYFINGHKLGPFDILRDFTVTTVGDLKIYYNVTKNMYGDDFIVFVDGSEVAVGPLGKDRYPSLTMSLDEEGVAVLRWLERSKLTIIDCVDNLKELVMGAVKVSKGLGYTKFALVDDSCVGSSIYSYKYSLADMHFVCYGRTFYESILDVTVQYWSDENMRKYRDAVSNAVWSDVYKQLNSSDCDFDFKFDIANVDINAPGSCMIVLARVAALNNEASLKFFTSSLTDIQFATGRQRFHCSEWTLNL